MHRDCLELANSKLHVVNGDIKPWVSFYQNNSTNVTVGGPMAIFFVEKRHLMCET